MTEVCLGEPASGLLAYGSLGGGFLADRWVGAPEPDMVNDWSKMKYRRFIEAIGGWPALQALLHTAQSIARKHGVSVSNVATRWVLEQKAVAAIIVGARLGESEHREDNLKLFDFALDEEDHANLETAFAATKRLPGGLRRRISQASIPDACRLRRLEPSSRLLAPLWQRQAGSKDTRTAGPSTVAAYGSRSPATPAPFE